MTRLSERLPDDNENLAPLVRDFVQGLLAQNPWYHNIMTGSKDNLGSELYLPHQGPPKVQPMVAQIGCRYNLNISNDAKTSTQRRRCWQ